MTKTFTRNDMIRYFYKEMTQEESSDFKRVLNENPGFRNEYSKITFTLQQISSSTINPPDRVVGNILSFSKHFNEKKQKV